MSPTAAVWLVLRLGKYRQEDSNLVEISGILTVKFFCYIKVEL